MKLVAMERISFPNGILGRGIPVNRLMYVADDYKHSFHSAWACFERIENGSVKHSHVVNCARAMSRMIKIEYFASMNDGDMDAYELYVSIDRACEIIANENNFVYKFELLSRAVSNEYSMIA